MKSFFLFLVLFLHANVSLASGICTDIDNHLERLIRDRILYDQLKDLEASELLELYNAEALGERLKSVRKILDSLKPYSEGFKNLTIKEKQLYARDRAKAFSSLAELGMKMTEAKKTVNELMGDPKLLQKMIMMVTTIDTLIERENGNPWIMRSAGLTAFTLLLTPSVTTISLFATTGYYLPIPMMGKLESASVMLLALYGAKGMRLFYNTAVYAQSYKIGQPIPTREILSEGKREWKDVDAEFSAKMNDIMDQVISRTKKSYTKRVEPWAGKYVNFLGGNAKRGWSATLSHGQKLNQLVKLLVLDLTLFVNIHRHRSIEELYLDSINVGPTTEIERQIKFDL